MKKRTLIPILLFVPVLVLTSCTPSSTPTSSTVSTEQPLDVAQQKTIIQDISEDKTVWRSWDVFHTNINQWLTNNDPVISQESISDPLMNNTLFVLENAGSISPEDAANQLIKNMLEEFSVPNPSLRNFTVSDYRATEQKLLKKQDIVDQAIALCGTDELSTNYNEMVEWCQFYFSQYPGIEEENMWIFTPAFSFAWTGQVGVLTYEEALEFADQDGLVDIMQVLSRSPEANYYLLVKDGEIYYMRSLESIYAQLEESMEASMQTEPEMVEYQEPEQVILLSDSDIMPFTGETSVKNEPISEDGISWYQEQKYSAYCIWVQNDTNQEMKITVTYTGMADGESLVFHVQPGKESGMAVNNAWESMQHYVDFQTENGSLEGTCSVEISDTPFDIK